MLKHHSQSTAQRTFQHLEELLTVEKAKRFCDEKNLSNLGDDEKEKVIKSLSHFVDTGKIIEETGPLIEAIIYPEIRPVFDIQDGTYSKVDSKEWDILNREKVKKRLNEIIPAVGRLEVPTNTRIPYAGTGFLVAEEIIMTNRHVAEIFCSGLGVDGININRNEMAGIDFKEERFTPSIEDEFFDIEEVLMIHPYWDMALLKIKTLEKYKGKKPLKLSSKPPRRIFNRDIAVIGYPAFDSRNDGNVQNRVFDGRYYTKRLQPGKTTGTSKIRSYDYSVEALKHDASTLGGNSGSAVIDLATGEVIGLHFAGKYLKSNYAVPIYELAKDRFVQQFQLNFAGELPKANYHWHPVWGQVDRLAGSSGSNSSLQASPEAKREQNNTIKIEGTISPEGKLSISVPIDVKFETEKEVKKPQGQPPKDFFEGFVGTYEEREGYNKDFLGETVSLPWLSDNLYDKAARNALATSSRHVLTYTNFSIVMNRERRLAFFSAVNIDGGNKGDIPKNSGASHSWYFDDRISRDYQMDNDYYRDAGGDNPLDRGHVVRRIEPTWGNNHPRIIKAHNDTFHWTNCSPQHSKFNKQGYLWAKIENFLLDNARVEKQRISVFSGPVFSDTDPLYMAPSGVQVHLPVEFWKVVVYKTGNKLQARAFLLSQEKLVNDMVEALKYDQYNQYQLPISELESIIDIKFENPFSKFKLSQYDAFINNQELINGSLRKKIDNVESIFT